MGKLYDDVVVKLPVIIMYGDESEWDQEEKERVLGNDEAYGLEGEEGEEGGGEVEGGGEEPEGEQDLEEQEVGDEEAEPEAGGDGDGENVEGVIDMEDVEDAEGAIEVEDVADAGQQEEEAACQGQINLLTVQICQDRELSRQRQYGTSQSY